MKLNIVTAGANSVGKSILEKVANQDDITISLSRKGCGDIANVLDVKISDLTNKEITQKELLEVLSQLSHSEIDHVRLFHNCCFAAFEFSSENVKKYPELALNPKGQCYDIDGDGIDDRAYHSLITTFRNVFSVIYPLYIDKMFSIGTICSLTDKKKVYSEKLKEFISPSMFRSMIKTNRKLRDEINSLAQENENIQSVCLSASTVNTATEAAFRKYSKDIPFWVKSERIADVLLTETQEHRNEYKDIDVFVHNRRWNKILSKETDEKIEERIIFDHLGYNL